VTSIRPPSSLACAILFAVAACSSGSGTPAGVSDAAMDAVSDAAKDAVSDAARDAGVDSPSDVASLGDAASGDVPTIVDAAGSPDAARDAPPTDGSLDLPAVDSRPDAPSNDTGGGCGANLILCGTTCIDPTSDLKHCGATPGCGTNGSWYGAACASGSACSTIVYKDHTFPTGSSPKAVVVADLNADGKVDLAVANAGSGDVSVLLGNGDGTFQSEQRFAAHTAPQSIAAGDVNGNGKPDLVVANNTSGDVSVLLGNGDGTFQAHADIPIADRPYKLVLGDVNGDHKLDLAVACGGPESTYVLLGAGNGTFQADVQLTTTEVGTSGTAGVGAADLDGDGKLDIAINDEKGVDVYLGDGDGSFQPRLESYFYSGSAIAFGDLDGDGKQDVVAEALMGAIALLAKNGWLIKSSAQDITLGGEDANSLAIADLDGDGKMDVAATSSYAVVIARGRGDGTFLPAQGFVVGNGMGSVVVHDLDGDGRPDLVATDSGGNVVHVLIGGTGPLTCR
jgi:hypothetical protein